MTTKKAKAPEPQKAPPQTKAKKVRQLPPPPSNLKQFDPAEYEFDTEPEAAVENTAPAAPESAPEKSIIPAPAKQSHSPRMIRRALDLQVPQADIDGFTSDELFDEIIYRQNQVANFQEAERRQSPRGPLVSEPVALPPEEDELGLDPLVDPSISSAFKKMLQKNKELQDKLDKAGEREQTRERETRNDKIDRTFSGLTDYHEIFGKGHLGELSHDELACRQAVLAVAEADKSLAPLEQKLTKAVKTLYRQKPAPPAPVAPPVPASAAPKEPAYEQPHATNGSTYEDEELAKRRAVWNQSTVAEPTARKGSPEPKGIQLAKKTYIKGMQEAHLDPNALAVEETSELPD